VQHCGPLRPTRQREHTPEGALGEEQAESRNRDAQQSPMRACRGDDHRYEQRNSQNRQHPVGEAQVQGAADDDERRDGGSPKGGQPQPGTGRDLTPIRSHAPTLRAVDRRTSVSHASLLH
jgi:hypothetical protein